MSDLPKLPAPTLARLAKLGIRCRLDLVLHLPLRYEDETHLYPIADAMGGMTVQVEGIVEHCEVVYRPRKQLLARIQDGSGELWARFLNFYPSQQKQLAEGRRVRLYGEVRHGYYGPEMVHPRVRNVEGGADLPEALTPVYPTVAGLTQASLRKLITQALAPPAPSDTLPPQVREALGLMAFGDSVQLLHHPPTDITPASLIERGHPAWQRIKFDELLAQQLSMRLAYRQRRDRHAPVLAGNGQLVAALLAALPFGLTAAQQRVLAEIRTDLQSAHPMQRLLQGDVGSGKTIVAALAALVAIESGFQAALMAPTEILAEQHYLKFKQWLTPLGLEVVWLSSSLKTKAKAAALTAVAEGRADIAVGTHALFQNAVSFERLGLAIVDEQHRFGVHQRLALRNKGGSPHQLMMSATPIPRSLAMTYYADLDVSAIDELPPGRTPVVTRLVRDERRDEVIERVRQACLKGRQAYWVCPLIEESETLELQTAVDTHLALSEDLQGLQVGLIHGRLKPDEKAGVMAAFAGNQLQVLVATTVIEVGVDVPNASLMVIEHAERMGLAQLHQLRGRVGRGAAESECILLFNAPLSEQAKARLKVIFETTDGFEIARQDLLLRGPGEFLGARQSGLPMLRFADLEADSELLELARELAPQLISDYPQAASDHLNRWMAGRDELLKV